MLYRTMFLCTIAATLFASDSPFVGTWKENRSKGTDSSELTVREKGNGIYHMDFGIMQIDANPDGKPTPGPIGGNFIFTKVDSSTWLITMDTKNKPRVTYHLKDKNTLEVSSEEVAAAGGVIKSTADYVRTDSSSGLAGAWKQQQISQTTGPVNTLTIKGTTEQGLSIDSSLGNVSRKMTFDGKEYPVSGALFPVGMKASGKAKLVDSDTIVESRIVNGKELDKAEYKLSPDKKTLTVTINAPKDQEKTVYERQ